MGELVLHLANANQKFTAAEVALIARAARAAEGFTNDHFQFDYQVDLVVMTPSYLLPVIPEDGIGGRTYHAELVMIALDREQKAISEDAIFEMLCHEMSHSLRWQKLPEYASTLFENMILEGLGVVLEEQAMEATGRPPQFFLNEVQRATPETIDQMIATLKGELEHEHYDYDTIFFTGSGVLPRWIGYKLGYYYVKEFLRRSGATIFDATLASYAEFGAQLLND